MKLTCSGHSLQREADRRTFFHVYSSVEMDKPEVPVKLLDELKVISVPPSGNSMCRVSAKNI